MRLPRSLLALPAALLLLLLLAAGARAQSRQDWGPVQFQGPSGSPADTIFSFSLPNVPVLADQGIQLQLTAELSSAQSPDEEPPAEEQETEAAEVLCGYDVCLNWLARTPAFSASTRERWRSGQECQRHCSLQIRISNDSSAAEPQQPQLDESCWFPGAPGGVYQLQLLRLPESSARCRFRVAASGQTCLAGTFGPDCIRPTEVRPGVPANQLGVPADGWLHLLLRSMRLGANPGRLLAQLELTGGQAEVFLRNGAPHLPAEEEGTPEPAAARWDSAEPGLLELAVSVPRRLSQDRPEGLYFVSVRNTGSQALSVNVSLQDEQCGKGSAGPDCGLPLQSLSRQTALVVDASKIEGNWFIAELTGLRANQVSVGITSLDAQAPPELWLRRGNVPLSAPELWDARERSPLPGAARTRLYASGATRMSGEASWFLAVPLPRTGEEAATAGLFGIWLEDECPGNCNRHGQCVRNECVCDEGWQRLWDCSRGDNDEGEEPGDGGSKMDRQQLMVIVFAGLGGVVFLVLLCVICRRRSERSRRRRLTYDYLTPARAAGGLDDGYPGAGPGGLGYLEDGLGQEDVGLITTGGRSRRANMGSSRRKYDSITL